MTAVLERPSMARKAEEVEALASFIDKYNVLVVASLYKVRSMQLQTLSKKFRGDVQMRVAKNTILRRALEASKKEGVAALSGAITGSNVLLLTNMNPFRLSLLLDRNKIKMSAKVGDIAPDDILIAAGNTGLAPGPAISELSEAGIRTRIESGSVYVLQDTVVAKKGDPIQSKVASVLSKLGIKPLEVGLSVIAAFDGGLVLKADDLHIDLDEIRKELETAFGSALGLSVNVGFPTPDNVRFILQRGQAGARSLAVAAGYASSETVGSLLSKAYSDMVSLSRMVAKVNKVAAPPEFQG
jgi:large subunit ribosomal protein L10